MPSADTRGLETFCRTLLPPPQAGNTLLSFSLAWGIYLRLSLDTIGIKQSVPYPTIYVSWHAPLSSIHFYQLALFYHYATRRCFWVQFNYLRLIYRDYYRGETNFKNIHITTVYFLTFMKYLILYKTILLR